MALDLNDPELEFADLVYAYQSWVMAVINDESSMVRRNFSPTTSRKTHSIQCVSCPAR